VTVGAVWSDAGVFDVTVEEDPSGPRRRLEDPGAAPTRSESCRACPEGSSARAARVRGQGPRVSGERLSDGVSARQFELTCQATAGARV
jgi:hypothetical protein